MANKYRYCPPPEDKIILEGDNIWFSPSNMQFLIDGGDPSVLRAAFRWKAATEGHDYWERLEYAESLPQPIKDRIHELLVLVRLTESLR